MKKRLVILWMVLLCLLAGCAAGTVQPTDTTGKTTTETGQTTEVMTQPTEAATEVTEATQPVETTAETTQLVETTAETTQPVETTAETTQPVETTAETLPPIDYTVFCGNYSDTETVEGPCYTVSIISVDNESKAIELAISFVGRNSSPVYAAEQIYSTIESDHTAQFEWEDSWENRGVGTLVLNPDDPSAVQLMMTVTEEAEVNRATLSTRDEYKTFVRR